MGGTTTASGYYSTAMGDVTKVSDYSSLSIGAYNKSNATVTSGGSATQFSANNTAFVIGNGTSFKIGLTHSRLCSTEMPQ